MKGCRPFTEEECNAIIDSFSGDFATRNRTLFILGIKSGFRITELLSLKVKDLYNGTEVIDAVYVQRKSMKKKVEGRSVVLNPSAKEAILNFIAESGVNWETDADKYMFRSRKGNGAPLSRAHVWKIIHAAAESCGYYGKIGTHSMRKTFADRIYNILDHDVRKTQEALGHKNINSTAQYIGVNQDEINAAIMSL